MFCIFDYIFGISICIFCIFYDKSAYYYSAYFVYLLLLIFFCIFWNESDQIAWLHRSNSFSQRTSHLRQTWAATWHRQHQGSSTVTLYGLEPFGWTLEPWGGAALARPVLQNPSLPSLNAISLAWVSLSSSPWALRASCSNRPWSGPPTLKEENCPAWR